MSNERKSRAEDSTLAELDRLLDGMGREMARSMEAEKGRLRLRRVFFGSAAAVAAAAVAAGIALRPFGPGTEEIAPDAERPGLDVESPRAFAVFETRDPDVNVIWLLEGE